MTGKTSKTSKITKRSAAKRAPAKGRAVLAKRAVRKPRSDLLASIHETMSGLHAEGHVGKATMRRFDAMCLAPVKTFAPKEIARIRASQAVSQAVFAKYLNTSTDTISKWEQGKKRPTALGRTLLAVFRRQGLQALA